MRTLVLAALTGSAVWLAILAFRPVPPVADLGPTERANRQIAAELAKLDATNQALRAQIAESSASAPEAKAKAAGSHRPVASIPSLLEHPETARMGFDALRAAQKHRYRALFSWLGFSEAERDAVATAIAEHASGHYDLAMLNMGRSANAVASDMKKNDEEFAANLENLLGHDSAAKVVAAVQKGADWDSLQRLQDQLSYSGDMLGSDQMDALMSIWTTKKMMVPLTSDGMESFIARKTENNAKIIAQARQFLAATQVDALAGELSANLSSTLYSVYAFQAQAAKPPPKG